MGLTTVKATLSDKRIGRLDRRPLVSVSSRTFAPIAAEPRLTFQRVRRTDARIEEALSRIMAILCERPHPHCRRRQRMPQAFRQVAAKVELYFRVCLNFPQKYAISLPHLRKYAVV
jgi:hypothetical protein